MQARPGDWLVVHSDRDSRHERRAQILTVSCDGGEPFRVRWIDTGHETLVFPGPDAVVIAAERQQELDHERAERIARVQEQISATLS